MLVLNATVNILLSISFAVVISLFPGSDHITTYSMFVFCKGLVGTANVVYFYCVCDLKSAKNSFELIMKNEMMDIDFNLDLGGAQENSEVIQAEAFGDFTLEPMEFPDDVFGKKEDKLRPEESTDFLKVEMSGSNQNGLD